MSIPVDFTGNVGGQVRVVHADTLDVMVQVVGSPQIVTVDRSLSPTAIAGDACVVVMQHGAVTALKPARHSAGSPPNQFTTWNPHVDAFNPGLLE